MRFPIRRMRRLRQNPLLRRMVEETTLSRHDLIYPLFVVPGEGVKEEIPSMPGVFHFSIDRLVEEGKEVAALGIPAVILFGIPESKDPVGSGAYAQDGIVPRAIETLKRNVPDLLVFADVCLCEYTDHGHCGVIRDGAVANDPSVELLARAGVTYARAGADLVAPSDMMDGRVRTIRAELDEHGFPDIPIMAYSAKFASAFYGPFREAARSAPQFGDRRSYQMDPPNGREALEEARLDVEEGADIVMVKPALAYLDVVWGVRQRVSLPVAAYNVSGEYAMVKAAARAGWIDEPRIVLEILTGIKRAGADLILTYHAKDAIRWLSTLP